MSIILTVTLVFAGIGVLVATVYSASQILLTDGESRAMHALSVGLILAATAAMLGRDVELARILAALLFFVQGRMLITEQHWYRVFPILVMLFALMLMMGYAALD